MVFFNVHCNCLLVGCLTSQQQASVSQGRICSDNFTCCHTEIEVADQTFYVTQSQYTDTGRPVPVLTLSRQAPGRVATGVPIFKSLVWFDPEKIPAQAGFEPGTFRSRGGRLTTKPTRRSFIASEARDQTEHTSESSVTLSSSLLSSLSSLSPSSSSSSTATTASSPSL